MVEHGFVHERMGDFAEAEYAASITAFTWRPLLQMSSPVLEFASVPTNIPVVQYSRLDLLAVLHRQGFEPVTAPGHSWKKGELLVYRRTNMLRVTKLYFVCLACRDAILARGATEILHDGNAA